MPAIKKLLSNGDMALIQEDGSTTLIDPEGNIRRSPKSDGTNLAENASKFLRNPINLLPPGLPNGAGPTLTKDLATSPVGKELGKGIAEGASLGSIRDNQNPDGEIISPAMAAGRGAGRLIGGTIPIMATEGLVNGVADIAGSTPMLTETGQVLRAGKDYIGKPIRAITTGLTLGAAQGAVNGKGIGPALDETANTGAAFGGLHAVGQAAGYLRQVFGETLAESLQNHFINTDRKIAMKLREQGKDSLGKQAFNEDILSGFKNRDRIYDISKNELGRLENQIGGRLEANIEQLKKPSGPTTQIQGTPLLEYKPGTVETPDANPSPFFPKNVEPPAHGTPITQRYQILADGRRVNINPSGDIVPLPAKFETPYLGDHVRAPTIRENADITGFQTKDQPFKKGSGVGVFNPQTDAELASESTKGRDLARFAAQKYGLKNLPDNGFSTDRQGVISTQDIASAIDEVKSNFQTGTRQPELKDIESTKKSFLSNNPSQLTLPEALGLKRKLDDLVSKTYLSLEGTKIPVSTQIDEALANALRKKIYEVDPELGKLAARESFMIRLQTGLLPSVAKSGGPILRRGLFHSALEALTGTGVTNATSRGLNRTMGTPSNIIAPIIRRGAQSATQDYLNQNQ